MDSDDDMDYDDTDDEYDKHSFDGYDYEDELAIENDNDYMKKHINDGGNYLVLFYSELYGKWYIKVGHTENFKDRFKKLRYEYEIDWKNYYSKFDNIRNLIIVSLYKTGEKKGLLDTCFRKKMQNLSLTENYVDRKGKNKREVYKMSYKVIEQYYSFFEPESKSKWSNWNISRNGTHFDIIEYKCEELSNK